MAFSPFLGFQRLETCVLPAATSVGNPLLQATRGVADQSSSGGTGGAASPVAALTLPDGRLDVGTHLPLLARRYKYLSSLGEGVSAQVILAEDILAAVPGTLVAIKCLKRQHALAGQREARALRYLHASAPGGVAPGVVRLLDSFMLGAHYCLVTERLYPWLLDWVAESSALPWQETLHSLRKIAHQLLMSVAFMHNCGLVCADIKPDNLLLCNPPGSRSVAVRIVDLGSCFSLTETDTQAVGCEVQTLPYRAPEAALGLPYGAAIDLWSVGVIIAEMALQRALLPCATPRDLMHQMVGLLGPLPDHMLRGSALAQEMGLAGLAGLGGGGNPRPAAIRPAVVLPPLLAQWVTLAAAGKPELSVPPHRTACQLYAELAAVDAGCADLVNQLLAYDPTQRLTAHQALLHPWFDATCPLRAIFPQLQELCNEQQAALRQEAGTTPAAAAAASAAAPAPLYKPAAFVSGGLPPNPAKISATPLPAIAAAMPAEPGTAMPQAHAGTGTGADMSMAAAAEADAAEAAAIAAADPSTTERHKARQQPDLPLAEVPSALLPPGSHPAEIDSAKQQQQQQQQQQSGQQHRQQKASEEWRQPWHALAADLAHSKQLPHNKVLPASQLAAQHWDQQQRMAARDPYAGAFSLEVTPHKAPAGVPTQPYDQQHHQPEQQPEHDKELQEEVEEEQQEQDEELQVEEEEQQQAAPTAIANDAAAAAVEAEAVPEAGKASGARRRGGKESKAGGVAGGRTPRNVAKIKAAGAGEQQHQQEQQQVEQGWEEHEAQPQSIEEGANAFDLLLEAATADSAQQDEPPMLVDRSGTKKRRRGKQPAGNAVGAGGDASTADRKTPKAKKQAATGASTGTAQGGGRPKAPQQQQRQQQRSPQLQQRGPAPSVAGSSGAVPRGNTPAVARTAALQPEAVTTGGKGSRKAQQPPAAVASKAGEGGSAAAGTAKTPATLKRKLHGAAGSEARQSSEPAVAPASARKRQKAGTSQEPASTAVDAATAVDGAPPGTSVRQRRDQQGAKAPWWVVG